MIRYRNLDENYRKGKLDSKGFTLVELLVVVALIIIVVGVSGDIIVSLVRSYNKTQIQNEIEQNLNFVLTKVENDLRNATAVTTPGSTGQSGNTLVLERRDTSGTATETITYEMSQANEFGGSSSVWVLARTDSTSGTKYPLTNYRSPYGITFDLNTAAFANVSSVAGPQVIQITLTANQIGTPVAQFRSSKTVNSTIVVRGTY